LSQPREADAFSAGGDGELLGMLRLRVPVRVANQHAALKMTRCKRISRRDAALRGELRAKGQEPKADF